MDRRGRTAESRPRALLGTEPPDQFVGFGRPILSPVDGIVVDRHEGEPDHDARRSALSLVPYLLGQRGRLRQGLAAIAGNYVILGLPDLGAFVGMVHLRRGSVQVSVGETVAVGQHLGECGNSGNSTQPHLHVQAMDSVDLSTARGIPLSFRQFWEQPPRQSDFVLRESGVPAEGAVVESA